MVAALVLASVACHCPAGIGPGRQDFAPQFRHACPYEEAWRRYYAAKRSAAWLRANRWRYPHCEPWYDEVVAHMDFQCAVYDALADCWWDNLGDDRRFQRSCDLLALLGQADYTAGVLPPWQVEFGE